MRSQIVEIENCMERLLAVLDKDAEHLENSILKLSELRCLVVKQDSVSLEQLLEKIRSGSAVYHENEYKRQMLRAKLADLIGCGQEKITLSGLEKQLSQESRNKISKRKNKLRTLATELQKEYSCTRMLLTDCARFNRLLLKRIFEAGQSQDITYRRTGNTEQSTDTVFMNLQL